MLILISGRNRWDTVDVNENVYMITSINPRKEAANALERALED
jgi:hypothetical protein